MKTENNNQTKVDAAAEKAKTSPARDGARQACMRDPRRLGRKQMWKWRRLSIILLTIQVQLATAG